MFFFFFCSFFFFFFFFFVLFFFFFLCVCVFFMKLGLASSAASDVPREIAWYGDVRGFDPAGSPATFSHLDWS